MKSPIKPVLCGHGVMPLQRHISSQLDLFCECGA